jgi:ATP-dependent protease HslVU (ClpYQ) peptidase subunit
MTCVVGVISNGKVHMACDSAASDSDIGSVHKRKDAKVFMVDDYIIGFSNSFRMGQLLQYDFYPPIPNKRNLEKTMCIDFVDAIQKCLAKNNFIIDKDDDNISDLIIGVHGRLFVMDTDFNMGEYYDKYFAIGSGYQFALGSLYSTKHIKNPRTRLTKALEASAEYTMGVEPPFLYLSE